MTERQKAKKFTRKPINKNEDESDDETRDMAAQDYDYVVHGTPYDDEED